jgi:hypothetical protein
MEIKNTEIYGFKAAFRGMRNPMDSWAKSDSYYDNEINHNQYIIGNNDMNLAQTLIKSGSEHCKFLRMIHVSADFDMPRYFWSEFDTYHYNTKNSCSTMHKLLNNNNPITLDMFETCDEDAYLWNEIIVRLEEFRLDYKELQKTTKNKEEMDRLLLRAKRLLPEGMLQLRTIDTNYAELRNMYFQRRNHRLKEEWINTFCKWVENLPYADELICFE